MVSMPLTVIKPAHGLPWQADAAQELAHPALHFNHLPQRIGLRRADSSRVAHLSEQLRDDIVVGFDLDRQERRAHEVFQGIDDAVQELEDEERLDLGGGGGEE